MKDHMTHVVKIIGFGFVFALLVTGVRAAAPPALLEGILSGGPAGQARVVSGESIWLDQIRFSTPHDFEKLPPNTRIYNFDTLPHPIEFESVEELTFENLTEELIGSRPDMMETYRLGSVRMAVPPPPDWRRSYDQIPPWSRAVAAGQVDQLPFVNGAVFCWVGGTTPISGSSNVYLFRQHFEVTQHDRLARATLRLATNADPLEISINDHPVEVAAKVGYRLASYEITQLLQPGINLIAIRVSERPKSTEAYGLGFHIELLRRAKEIPAQPIKPADALVTSKSGDRIWGAVHDMNNDGIAIDSAYGRYRLEWNECGAVLFPAGWQPEQPEPAMMDRVRGKVPPAPELPVFGLPTKSAPSPLQDVLFLTGNRRTTARPQYARDGQLFFEGIEGRQFAMKISDVLGIYPPQPIERVFQRPRAETAILYCRLMTTRGEQMSGLLRQLRGTGAVLETDSGNFLELKSRGLSSIYFPFHGADETRATAGNQRLGIMPLATGSEAYRVTYQNDMRRVQAAAFSIDAEADPLNLEAISDSTQLTPAKNPAVVYIDPVGEYVQTMNANADAQNALLNYVEQGGHLIVLARGGAFRTAVRNDAGAMLRTPADMTRPNLADALGLRTLRPASGGAAGVTPFNHPANTGRTLFFQRGSQMPQGLMGLERRVRLGSMPSAPFYPMVATGSGAILLYDLRDDSGAVFGPAMQIIPKGRGAVVVIDHLLWESEIDDIPFSERELPKILKWALSPNS